MTETLNDTQITVTTKNDSVSTAPDTGTVLMGDFPEISRRMLRLARFLERLPGDKQYVIRLIKPKSETERWTWEISEVIVVREMDM